MNSYKVTFSFKNGASGEMILKAQSDKVAFLTAFKLFSDFDNYEWDIKEEQSTRNLVQELASREGVQDIVVEPHVPFKIEVDGKVVQCDVVSGPCHIIVVYD